jgi:hypothetical protein
MGMVMTTYVHKYKKSMYDRYTAMPRVQMKMQSVHYDNNDETYLWRKR